MTRSKILGTIFILTFAAIGIFAVKCFSDTADLPFSDKLAASIGAWYDERWQASGFYRLEEGAPAGSFVYQYIERDQLETDVNPTFVGWGPDDNAAVIPQDVVVTQWSVSGHVHFASGM